MKVIRSYSDYYDGVLAHFAQEQVPFYLRKRIEIDKMEYNDLSNTLPKLQGVFATPFKKDRDAYITTYLNQVELDTAIIGFCGKLYVVFYVQVYSYEDVPSHAFPSVDYLREAFEVVDREWVYEFNANNNRTNIQLIVDTWVNQKPLLDLFIKHTVPSFIYTKRNLILNPCLKDFNMQKVLHPYTVVQELEMFLNNTLCDNNTPPMPVGDDVIIAESKGYDKWSFRKMPEPNKKNKKGTK